MPCRAFLLAIVLLTLTPSIASAAPDRTKPTKPGTLRVTATTTTSVALAWGASTDNSGSVSYIVRESSGTTRASGPTSFTRTGLTPNRTYRFAVSAVDPTGNRSAESNQVSATTPASTAPATPANLRTTAAGLTTLSLAWDPVAGATRYELQSQTMGTYSTTGTTASFQWLQPDSAHTFTVRAFNAAGTPSAPSAPHTTRTAKDTTAPSTPVTTGSATSPSSLHLSWPASTDDANASSYNVDLDGRPWKHMLPTSPTAIDVFNLRDGTTYALTVRAYDSSGNFSAPASLELTTPESSDAAPPPAPTGLAAHWVTPHTVDLRWGPWSGFADTFAQEIHMDGAFLQDVVGDWRYSGMLFPGGQVRHLQPGTTHTFTVHNRDEAGNLSSASNAITVTLPPSGDTTPPAPATSLTGDTSPNCAFAFFTWTGGGGEPGDVEIYEDGHYLDVWRDKAFMTSFGRHDYTVRYVDTAGNTSAPSPPVTLDHGVRC